MQPAARAAVPPLFRGSHVAGSRPDPPRVAAAAAGALARGTRDRWALRAGMPAAPAAVVSGRVPGSQGLLEGGRGAGELLAGAAARAGPGAEGGAELERGSAADRAEPALARSRGAGFLVRARRR